MTTKITTHFCKRLLETSVACALIDPNSPLNQAIRLCPPDDPDEPDSIEEIPWHSQKNWIRERKFRREDGMLERVLTCGAYVGFVITDAEDEFIMGLQIQVAPYWEGRPPVCELKAVAP